MSLKKIAIFVLSFICILSIIQTFFYFKNVIHIRTAFLDKIVFCSSAINQWIEPVLLESDTNEIKRYISGGKHYIEMLYNECHVTNGAFTYNILWYKDNYLLDFTQIDVLGIKNRYMEIYNKCQENTVLSDNDYLFLENFNESLLNLTKNILDNDGKVKMPVVVSKQMFNEIWSTFIEETKGYGYYN